MSNSNVSSLQLMSVYTVIVFEFVFFQGYHKHKNIFTILSTSVVSPHLCLLMFPHKPPPIPEKIHTSMYLLSHTISIPLPHYLSNSSRLRRRIGCWERRRPRCWVWCRIGCRPRSWIRRGSRSRIRRRIGCWKRCRPRSWPFRWQRSRLLRENCRKSCGQTGRKNCGRFCKCRGAGK